MRLTLLTACAFLFALPAKADKFWLSDPATQKNTPATSSPDLIEGVLLAEDATDYHIRVVGGELVLAKKRVFKVEKDGLTLDGIVKVEKDRAEALALANQERQLQQQIARKERELKVAEAAAKKSAPKAVDAVAPRAEAPAFDPVIGVVRPAGDAQVELRAAYEATRDRDLLRQLRILRRLR